MDQKVKLPYIIHPEQDESKLRQKGVSLCALLDTIRPLKENKFSVRMRVIYNRTVRFYTTKIKVSKKDYEIICASNGSKEIKDFRKVIHEHLKQAIDAIDKMDVFTFNEFDRLLDRKKGDGDNVYYHFQLAIDQNKKHDRIGNANTFELSMKSIKTFTGEKEKLSINKINEKWLSDYEFYMTTANKSEKRKKRSKATVGIYLRALRTVFNMAKYSKDVSAEKYPFGSKKKNKYEIPTSDNVKKSLSSEQMKQLFDAKPRTPEQEKAKDFWFFSYSCHGMNIMDIANLKNSDYDIKNDCFNYVRAKTKNTNRNEKKISIYLNDYTRSIIKKYGNQDKRADAYIFPIINLNTSAEVQKSKVKAFTKFINQHIKKLAIAEQLPPEISTYWARHGWVTIAVRNGKSMKFVSDAIGHSSIITTQCYFDGFADKDVRDYSNNSMNF